MRDDELLRATIAAHPDDDLPRLVYADFLDDAGDADRAELIRVQVENDRRPTPDLTRREAELLAAHRPEWRIPGLTGPQTFRRGMIDSVETTAESLVRLEPGVFVLQPVRHLRLVNADRWTRELAALPVWGRIESLSLNNNMFGVGDRLDLLNTDMPALRTLSLRNNRLWPEAMAALAETRVAAQLRRLDVSGNPIADEGVATIARHPAFTGLTELIARSDELRQDECVSAAGARSVAQSWTLASLTTLNFDSHYLGDAGLMELVESSNAEQLVELDLSRNHIGEDGSQSMAVLTRSRHLGRLRRLNLSGNALRPLSIEALVHWPHAARMDWIDLRRGYTDRFIRGQIEASPYRDKFLVDDPPPEVA